MASAETKADQEGVGAGELSSAELSATEPFAGTTHALPASRHSGPQGTVALSHSPVLTAPPPISPTQLDGSSSQRTLVSLSPPPAFYLPTPHSSVSPLTSPVYH